jgi:decaprenyl-phosphate phosphoribosyltransferase
MEENGRRLPESHLVESVTDRPTPIGGAPSGPARGSRRQAGDSSGERELGTVHQRSLLVSLLTAARPRQWIKNLLVLAAPAAAGVLTHRHDLLLALGATGAFCLAASGVYLVNDVLDAAADRLHPAKRSRPVASGAISPVTAITVGIVLAGVGCASAELLAGGRLLAVLVVYVVNSFSYSLALKHEPVIDMVCVSAGFLLRAIAGGVAVHVPLSDWFLIVASFGSLLVVAGKRSAEYAQLGDQRSINRPTLGAYSAAFLRSTRILAASIAITAYCLWAFQRADSDAFGSGRHPIWFELSIVPVVIAMLLVELRFESGHGAAPEEMALKDHRLQLAGALWLALLGIGIYG